MKTIKVISIIALLLGCFTLGFSVGANIRSHEDFTYDAPEQCLSVCVDLFERFGC